MPVIAMTREMGSLGKDVALGLAEALDLQVVHHEVVERDLADRAHLKESVVHRFLEGDPGMLERWQVRGRVALYTAEEVCELATRGNVVIRGWGATHVLRPVPHVVCVRVCAPLELRTRVLMQRLGIDDEAIARREIERNDAAHARTMLQLFSADWQDAVHYDLVLNTERVPTQECVGQIRRLVESSAFQETETSREVLADVMLGAYVRTALRDCPETQSSGLIVDVAASARSGCVTLRGFAASEEFRLAAERVVSGVSGVTAVTNQVLRMRTND